MLLKEMSQYLYQSSWKTAMFYNLRHGVKHVLYIQQENVNVI